MVVSRLSKLSEKWVSVDIDNKFKFMGMLFAIPKENKDYIVYNSSNSMRDFTNESNMDSVLVKMESYDSGFSISFYNQELRQIKDVAIIE